MNAISSLLKPGCDFLFRLKSIEQKYKSRVKAKNRAFTFLSAFKLVFLSRSTISTWIYSEKLESWSRNRDYDPIPLALILYFYPGFFDQFPTPCSLFQCCPPSGTNLSDGIRVSPLNSDLVTGNLPPNFQLECKILSAKGPKFGAKITV